MSQNPRTTTQFYFPFGPNCSSSATNLILRASSTFETFFSGQGAKVIAQLLSLLLVALQAARKLEAGR
jgi:small neutral amino acid transporter SnatA (MarC family)